jgi:hypothetical protein
MALTVIPLGQQDGYLAPRAMTDAELALAILAVCVLNGI